MLTPEKLLKKIFEFAFDSKFKFGDVIRNKNPYKNEPSYKIENINRWGYVCSISPDFDKTALHDITFDEAEYYELCI